MARKKDKKRRRTRRRSPRRAPQPQLRRRRSSAESATQEELVGRLGTRRERTVEPNRRGESSQPVLVLVRIVGRALIRQAGGVG